MLIMMRMFNYSSLFSCPCDNHFKEEILPYLKYFLNFLNSHNIEVALWSFGYAVIINGSLKGVNLYA
jgi:hypothetical protein